MPPYPNKSKSSRNSNSSSDVGEFVNGNFVVKTQQSSPHHQPHQSPTSPSKYQKPRSAKPQFQQRPAKDKPFFENKIPQQSLQATKPLSMPPSSSNRQPQHPVQQHHQHQQHHQQQQFQQLFPAISSTKPVPSSAAIEESLAVSLSLPTPALSNSSELQLLSPSDFLASPPSRAQAPIQRADLSLQDFITSTTSPEKRPPSPPNQIPIFRPPSPPSSSSSSFQSSPPIQISPSNKTSKQPPSLMSQSPSRSPSHYAGGSYSNFPRPDTLSKPVFVSPSLNL